MSRGIRKTMTVIMILLCVFVIFSSGAFSKVFVKVDLEGLKNVHIRADIYEETNGNFHPPKHGKVQFRITEEQPVMEGGPRQYSYKFSLDLRRATPEKPYRIWIKATLPNVKFTIYGDTLDDDWLLIQWIALNRLNIDEDYAFDNKIVSSFATLGIVGDHERDTGIDVWTDVHGNYRNMITGGIEEMVAIEWAIDFGSPYLKEILLSLAQSEGDKELIEWFFSIDRNFDDFGITGVTMHGGVYPFKARARFVGPEDPENPGEPIDVYTTEEVSFTYAKGDFIWTPQ